MIIIAILLIIIGISKIYLVATADTMNLDVDNLPITKEQGRRIAEAIIGLDSLLEILAGLFILFL